MERKERVIKYGVDPLLSWLPNPVQLLTYGNLWELDGLQHGNARNTSCRAFVLVLISLSDVLSLPFASAFNVVAFPWAHLAAPRAQCVRSLVQTSPHLEQRLLLA